MAIIKTDICKLNNIINNKEFKLEIPIYQRPYLWSKKSVIKLFDDIFEAYKDKEKIDEYRLGTIILHKEKDKEIYNIVDGQQRLITLSLLINNVSNKKYSFLLDNEINELSVKSIITNNRILEEKKTEINNNEDFLNYVMNNCTLGIIVTDKQEEAFQFFDSQNTRGKKLAPHDLLKAYHLRELTGDEEKKRKIIEEWESIKEYDLKKLFFYYLYPIRLWSDGKNEIDFTEEDIDVYEGISNNTKYNYLKYRQKNREEYVFQLNEPIFSGEYFFKYIFHYKKLCDEIEKIKNEKIKILDNETYINTIFFSALLLIADRFNKEEAEKESIVKKIYEWSYGFRLSRKKVTRQGRNKYVTGRFENGLGCGPLMKKINEMKNPNDIIKLEIKIDDVNYKYDEIRKLECFINNSGVKK